MSQDVAEAAIVTRQPDGGELGHLVKQACKDSRVLSNPISPFRLEGNERSSRVTPQGTGVEKELGCVLRPVKLLPPPCPASHRHDIGQFEVRSNGDVEDGKQLIERGHVHALAVTAALTIRDTVPGAQRGRRSG